MSTKVEVDLLIRNVHLCQDHSRDDTLLYDVACVDGKVVAVQEAEGPSHKSTLTLESTRTLDAQGLGLLIPGLCHAHIHLDKCFLLDRCELRTGDFKEALAVTAKAKAQFPADHEDLLRRGRRLIMDSISSGVVAMRAHVEVDETVGFSCLQTGLLLKEEMKDLCHVQVVAFAQDPLFESSGQPKKNFGLLAEASGVAGVEVVGSAPYVEASTELAKQNIKYLFKLAYSQDLHLDFHLDYNLDQSTEPLIWDVLDELRSRIETGRWKATKRVCVGHATRLTLWDADQWKKYRKLVADHNLPITLVGLPQSDMYMMGRDVPYPPRSTLNISQLSREHGVTVAMAVNNVGNAFTPQGPPDPLALCPLGVALFQSGTKADCYRLIESVTSVSLEAVGLLLDTKGPESGTSSLFPRIGQRADFVLLHHNSDVQSAACSPCYDRTTIMKGRVVCERKTILSFFP
ncbi:hypothetical protein BDY19DRAFT_894810 [Irpex rosettiformis]|uniref:Uncharacterized protein n=1 Tax=Irpex rosettiformis TaxID=378272 RepID=A0ACB8TWW9_9APHY|nr:hypothetical protein BDY19DRAFT_894810 [Irpex rosettiformis]